MAGEQKSRPNGMVSLLQSRTINNWINFDELLLLLRVWEYESVRFCDHRNEQSQKYSSTISIEIEQNNRHISKCVCVCVTCSLCIATDAVIIVVVIFIIQESSVESERKEDSKHSIDIIELGFICDGIIFDKLHKWALNKNAAHTPNRRRTNENYA